MALLVRLGAVRLAIGATLIAALALWLIWRAERDATLARATEAPGRLEAAGLRWSSEAASVAGFPSRVDLTLERPRLEAEGWVWTADRLRVLGLVWRDDYLAFDAAAQSATTPLGAVAIGRLTASLGLDGASALTRLDLILEALRSADGLGARSIALHLRPDPAGAADRRRLYVAIAGLEAGPTAAEITLDGFLRFDPPPAHRPLAPGRVVALIAEPGVELTVGDATLTLEGRLERGADGWGGTLAFASDQARPILAALETSGALDSASAARLGAFVTDAGRLAAVLEVAPTGLRVLDLGTEDFAIAPAQRQ